MNIVYIAISLDGYIATSDHSVKWLDSFNDLFHENANSYFATSYEKFYNDIDNVIMGYNTYHVIKGLIDEYPYLNKPNYVITSKVLNDKNIKTISINEYLTLSLKGNNYIVGGGVLVSTLLKNNLIDKIILSVMPVVLGSGIPLFVDKYSLIDNGFNITSLINELNVIELTYQKR